MLHVGGVIENIVNAPEYKIRKFVHHNDGNQPEIRVIAEFVLPVSYHDMIQGIKAHGDGNNTGEHGEIQFHATFRFNIPGIDGSHY
jgi:hypothetical protein